MLGSQIRTSHYSSISAILAYSSSRLPVTSISASSSFSLIEHLLVVYGHARKRCMLYNIDVCHSKLMYPERNCFMLFSNLYYYA